VEKLKDEPLVNVPPRKPLGAAGEPTVESQPQTESERREVRDRWRIGFPEYDRYGDKGARGRDIPFKKGRWYDPYNQSLVKGRLSDHRQQGLHDFVRGKFDYR
jgi:hypothetical protein